MLEMRPCCEHCGRDLPNESTDAMICTFECTYCEKCALEVFGNVCPNCGGGFTYRPVRPKKYLEKYPVAQERIYQPKDLSPRGKHAEFLKEYSELSPESR